MLAFVHWLFLVLSLLLLVYIATRDFLTLRIRNEQVSALLILALVVVVIDEHSPWLPDAAAGGVLFVLGVAFWATGMMGAGDAKLYLPVGLLIGWGGLAIFAVCLLIASVLFLLVIRIVAALPEGPGPARRRLRQIAAGQGVPYAVPIAVATIATVLVRSL